MNLISIGKVSNFLGVSVSTIRHWEKYNKFIKTYRTPGGHRRYFFKDVLKFLGIEEKGDEDKRVIAYARVPSYDQKKDLERQKVRLKKHCSKYGNKVDFYDDLGSGIKYDKPRFKKLIKEICSRRVSKIVLINEDRLLRFGFPLIELLCSFFNVQIEVLEKKKSKNFEEDLVYDVMTIMTVFTAKIYGKRSRQNVLTC